MNLRKITCTECGTAVPDDSASGDCVCCALNLLIEPPVVLDEPPHRQIGGFQLIQKLGEGGMGVVWKALQDKPSRVVALKLVKHDWLASEKEMARFRAEFEVAASLDHPNIVPIYEVCDRDGLPYYTMRFIEGGSLAEQLAARPRPAEATSASRSINGQVPETRRGDGNVQELARESARLLIVLARAVHYAHQRGIIHRDLKPSNILLDALGQPYIADFGLAKRIASNVQLTQTDSIIGSVYYLAPEQAAGNAKHVTTVTDVYSLGVILYELLTGRLPFCGNNVLETLRLIRECDAGSPKQFSPCIPTDLANICLKCLEKKPSHRYESAESLALDLERWLDHRPVSAGALKLREKIIKWIRREPVKATALTAILTTGIVTSLLVSSFYLRRLPFMAMQHAVATANHDGVFLLRITAFKDDRVTENIFRYGFESRSGQWLQLGFVGIPNELIPSLRCQIKADQPGRPDPVRSSVLTNGQVFQLRVEERFDRSFYVASVGWSVKDVLAISTNGYISLTILSNRIDYPGEQVYPTGR